MEIQSCIELLTIHGIEGKLMEGWTRTCRLHGAWWADSVQVGAIQDLKPPTFPFSIPTTQKCG